MMSAEICVKRIIAEMMAHNPESAEELEKHAPALEKAYKIIVGAILDEVKAATVTLNFGTGMSGAPVAGILSTAPGSPVTGVGVFSPIPGTPATGALS